MAVAGFNARPTLVATRALSAPPPLVGEPCTEGEETSISPLVKFMEGTPPCFTDDFLSSTKSCPLSVLGTKESSLADADALGIDL